VKTTNQEAKTGDTAKNHYDALYYQSFQLKLQGMMLFSRYPIIPNTAVFFTKNTPTTETDQYSKKEFHFLIIFLLFFSSTLSSFHTL